MEPIDIGLRTQDFHEGLREMKTFGPKEAYYGATLLIGKAAVLAMHLRGLLYIDDQTILRYAAGQLGIGALELPSVLRELEEVDFVSVVGSGNTIKRVDIRIPEFRTGYEDLGERWKALGPTEIEQASVQTLQRLMTIPVKETELAQSLGMKSGEFSILQDIMKGAQLLNVQTISGEQVIFSPLAVDGNPTAYLEWAAKFPNEISNAIKTLTGCQGLPITDPQISTNTALADAINTGVVAPVQVSGATGEQRFLFAPRGGLSSEERIILDKARAILACVRYGQRFAAGRGIVNPRRILETLRDKKKFRKGHPDLFTQYGVLVEKFIGHPVDEGGGRWNFEVHDTPENIKAFDVAISMLEIGESPAVKLDLEARSAIVSTGEYLSPISTRARIANSIKGSPETQAEIIKQMGEIARGMKL